MKLNEKLELFLVSLLTSFLVLGLFWLLIPKPKTIATVDLHHLIKPMIEAELKNSQPIEMKKNALQKKMKKLHEQLKLIAEKQHFILIPKEAIIAGANDYTLAIESFIASYPQEKFNHLGASHGK